MNTSDTPSGTTAKAPSQQEVDVFVRAAGNGDFALVEKFISLYPAHIDKRHGDDKKAYPSDVWWVLSDTALCAATEGREPRIMRLLIDAGADVDQENGNGVAALILAASGNYAEGAKILIDSGADVEIMGGGGFSLADIAHSRAAKEKQKEAAEILKMIEEAPEKRRIEAEKKERELEMQRSPALQRDLPVRSPPRALLKVPPKPK